jgi:hypothetical protein
MSPYFVVLSNLSFVLPSASRGISSLGRKNEVPRGDKKSRLEVTIK